MCFCETLMNLQTHFPRRERTMMPRIAWSVLMESLLPIFEIGFSLVQGVATLM